VAIRVEYGYLILLSYSQIFQVMREPVNSIEKFLVGPPSSATHNGLLCRKELEGFL